jgi:hypothetical protein
MSEKKFMLKMNLQHFGRDELDLSALRSQFEEEYQEEETPEDLPENPEELEADLEDPENPEDPEDLEDPEDTEDPEDPENPEDPEDDEDEELDRDEVPDFAKQDKKPKQSAEENAAFAQLRREKEDLARQAKVAEQIAAQYGMTVPEFEAALAEQDLKARAEEQKVPVDVLRRLEAAERKLAESETSSAKDKFWSSVDSVKEKYGLKKNEIDNVFHYIGNEGLVNQATGLPLIDFEKAYKLANHDQLLARKEKESHQKRLADKKKRQQRSAIPHSNNASSSNNDADFSEEFDKRIASLKSGGVL